ncbi:MAG: LexA family transcriptional regulator [Bacteroidota bacterium]
MSILSDNIRYLRIQRNLSQKKLADDLLTSRSCISSYEDARSEPPLDTLKRMSLYFHISIDILIGVQITKVPLDQLLKMEDNRILLPIIIDKEGRDFIEIVPVKAKAGYLNGYGDPEFIEQLQHMHLPFLSKGKYRAFPIEGDSMPPHKNGSFIVARYLDSIKQIKNGETYVVLTQNEGVVYKRMFLKKNEKDTFILSSDNSFYKDYEIKAKEILELWHFQCSFCTVEHTPDDLNLENVSEMFRNLQYELQEIKQQLTKQ